MNDRDKPLVWLHGEVQSPPFSVHARIRAGELLRRLQRGEKLEFPYSRPMPGVGPRCNELRVRDAGHNWRIIYRIDKDAVIIVAVFAKKTAQTPNRIMTECRRRIGNYDAL